MLKNFLHVIYLELCLINRKHWGIPCHHFHLKLLLIKYKMIHNICKYDKYECIEQWCFTKLTPHGSQNMNQCTKYLRYLKLHFLNPKVIVIFNSNMIHFLFPLFVSFARKPIQQNWFVRIVVFFFLCLYIC